MPSDPGCNQIADACHVSGNEMDPVHYIRLVELRYELPKKSAPNRHFYFIKNF